VYLRVDGDREASRGIGGGLVLTLGLAIVIAFEVLALVAFLDFHGGD
jgi:hypothetical protein